MISAAAADAPQGPQAMETQREEEQCTGSSGRQHNSGSATRQRGNTPPKSQVASLLRGVRDPQLVQELEQLYMENMGVWYSPPILRNDASVTENPVVAEAPIYSPGSFTGHSHVISLVEDVPARTAEKPNYTEEELAIIKAMVEEKLRRGIISYHCSHHEPTASALPIISYPRITGRINRRAQVDYRFLNSSTAAVLDDNPAYRRLNETYVRNELSRGTYFAVFTIRRPMDLIAIAPECRRLTAFWGVDGIYVHDVIHAGLKGARRAVNILTTKLAGNEGYAYEGRVYLGGNTGEELQTKMGNLLARCREMHVGLILLKSSVSTLEIPLGRGYVRYGAYRPDVRAIMLTLNSLINAKVEKAVSPQKMHDALRQLQPYLRMIPRYEIYRLALHEWLEKHLNDADDEHEHYLTKRVLVALKYFRQRLPRSLISTRRDGSSFTAEATISNQFIHVVVWNAEQLNLSIASDGEKSIPGGEKSEEERTSPTMSVVETKRSRGKNTSHSRITCPPVYCYSAQTGRRRGSRRVDSPLNVLGRVLRHVRADGIKGGTMEIHVHLNHPQTLAMDSPAVSHWNASRAEQGVRIASVKIRPQRTPRRRNGTDRNNRRDADKEQEANISPPKPRPRKQRTKPATVTAEKPSVAASQRLPGQQTAEVA